MLEGAEDCLLSSSGMNAATTMLLALVPAGGHIVTTTDCYRRTRQFIQTVLPKMGITATVRAAASLNVCRVGQETMRGLACHAFCLCASSRTFQRTHWSLTSLSAIRHNIARSTLAVKPGPFLMFGPFSPEPLRFVLASSSCPVQMLIMHPLLALMRR